MNSLKRGLLAAAVIAALGMVFGCGAGPQQTNFDATITSLQGDSTTSADLWGGGNVGYPTILFLVQNPDGTPVPNAEVIVTVTGFGAPACVTLAGSSSPSGCPGTFTTESDNEGKVRLDFGFIGTPACIAAGDQVISGSVTAEIGASKATWLATLTITAC